MGAFRLANDLWYYRFNAKEIDGSNQCRRRANKILSCIGRYRVVYSICLELESCSINLRCNRALAIARYQAATHFCLSTVHVTLVVIFQDTSTVSSEYSTRILPHISESGTRTNLIRPFFKNKKNFGNHRFAMVGTGYKAWKEVSIYDIWLKISVISRICS